MAGTVMGTRAVHGQRYTKFSVKDHGLEHTRLQGRESHNKAWHAVGSRSWT